MNTQFANETETLTTNFLRPDVDIPHPLAKMDQIAFKYIDRIASALGTSDDATILIVEDEPLINDMLADLMHDSGFSTIQAESAEEAVPYLTDDGQRIDLMMSDVALPGMDGHELLNVARDYRPELKVLFITGNPADEVLREDIKDENTELVTKPFRTTEVTEQVSAML